MTDSRGNREFALLVGKAFLHELQAGHKDAAIAFGRAFLLALGKKGPEESARNAVSHHRIHADHAVLAEN